MEIPLADVARTAQAAYPGLRPRPPRAQDHAPRAGVNLPPWVQIHARRGESAPAAANSDAGGAAKRRGQSRSFVRSCVGGRACVQRVCTIPSAWDY
eukprot:3754323-Pyramimonas_sp.AAC.1